MGSKKKSASGGGAASSSASASASAADSASAAAAHAHPPIELALREKRGLQFWKSPFDAKQSESMASEFTGAFEYSGDGRLLAQAGANEIVIFNCDTNSEHVRIAASVQSLAFSPQGTYLLTWGRPKTVVTPGAVVAQRLAKAEQAAAASGDGAATAAASTAGDADALAAAAPADAAEQPQRNLCVYRTSDGTLVGSCVHKHFAKEFWPFVQWTADEKHAVYAVKDKLHLFAGAQALNKFTQAIAADGVAGFQLAPVATREGRYRVAVFKPEHNAAPASVRVYQFPGAGDRPTASKSFFKAQRVEIKWNADASAVLILTHTDVDKTGASYFGETSLFFTMADGSFDCIVPLAKEGPIHDVAWAPDSKEFVVVHGHMPAKAVLYDTKCRPLFDCGDAPRNTVIFSPHGRLFALGGFGNLAGQVDFWDRLKRRKIGSMTADCAVAHIWAPDSRHFLTATLFPRMRVDNGFTVWKYNGTKVFHQDVGELYQVVWRPRERNMYPTRPLTPRPADAAAPSDAAPSGAGAAPAGAGRAAPAPAAPRKYVPPHMRGSAGGAGGSSSAGSASGTGAGASSSGGGSSDTAAPSGSTGEPSEFTRMLREGTSTEARKLAPSASESSGRRTGTWVPRQ